MPESADVRPNWPEGWVWVIRARAGRAQGVVTRALGLLVLVVLLVFCAQASAGFAPEPGAWASGPGKRPVVRFTVDPGTGLLQPVVRYRLGRCGALRGFSGRLSLGLVATAGHRFELVSRHRLPGRRRARVRLRFAGRFDSSFEAHGVLRGRVRVPGRRGCRIRAVSWVASAGGSPPVDAADDEFAGEIEEELEEDDCEDCEELPVDEDELPEDEDPGDEEPEPDDEP